MLFFSLFSFFYNRKQFRFVCKFYAAFMSITISSKFHCWTNNEFFFEIFANYDQATSLKWTGRSLFQISLVNFFFSFLLADERAKEEHVQNLLVISVCLAWCGASWSLCVYVLVQYSWATRHEIISLPLCFMSGRVHFKQLLASWIVVFCAFRSTSLVVSCFDFCYVISGFARDEEKKAALL